MTEVWKAVPDWAGLYEVSDAGRVRSLPRLITHYTGKILKRRGVLMRGCTTARGYVKVTLCVDGIAHGAHVHSLVAAAFIGPRPAGLLVRHLNGKSTDNRATNLAYGTATDNCEDARLHGTRLTHERHPRAKLSKADVLAMRAAKGAATYQALADRFNISINQVDNILNNRQWRHI